MNSAAVRLDRPDVDVIIVSRDTRELLRVCLASIEMARPAYGGEIHIIVVDCASSDDTVGALTPGFPRVRWLPSSENLGFTRGNNLALRATRSPLVLFLNPDTVIQPDALPRMTASLLDSSRRGLVGPRLLNPDGTTQSSRRRFPSVWTGFIESTVWQRWADSWNVVADFFVRDRSSDEDQSVDWVVGACMLAQRDALSDVGLFDESFFMYSEEVDLCRRLRDRGWAIGYVAGARVTHHEGQSSQRNLVRRDLLFHESRVRYYEKHFGAWPAALLRLATLVHFAILLGEESMRALLGRGPADERWPRVRAHWTVVSTFARQSLRALNRAP